MPKKIEKKRINKSAFVRSLPTDMPAAQVVAAAKKEGIKLSDKYVFNIRAKARAAGGKIGKPGRKKGAIKAVADSSNGRDDLRAFVDLALIIGLDKATETLQRVQEAVSKVV